LIVAHAADWLPFLIPIVGIVGWLLYVSVRDRAGESPAEGERDSPGPPE
jgi:hypothetical protein